jgi:hypothetical protein
MSKKKTVDFSHPSIGGKKVGHPVPARTEKPVDFTSIGGKCVRKASDHPVFNATPEAKDDEAHTD